ncbi:diguanylate cyclase domain-containing protein [Chitinilyticum piscinae]|uniref:Diguanylate cyclase n=1 Tax=Chitinilyticum piscinae TaxID=2866724 RepID=A0A8J7FXM7_9NEIS|nr:diguanylate cyclase [Chitinilyticum piscinae]MBE9608450.1 diguanylate cyclase [Chitinilyticum piscinae]
MNERAHHTARLSLYANITMALAYLLLAMLSIWLFRAGGIAIIWFANAVGIATLSRLPYRFWGWPVAWLAGAILLANLLGGTDVIQAMRFIPGNLGEMLAGAWLLRRTGLSSGFFFSLRNTIRLIWLGVCLPVLLGTALTAILLGSGGIPLSLHLLLHWLEGSMIGGVSLLPLAVWITNQGLSNYLRSVARLELLAHLLLAIAVTVLAMQLLPFPFIYASLPLFYIAYRLGLSGVLIANALVSFTICLLISLGTLAPPPTLYSWGTALFYLPILATLLPPLLLAVALEMNRSASLALQLSERRYRALYQQTPALLFSCDAAGVISSVNQLWLQTMGYAQHEVLGTVATEFMDQDSASRFRNQVLPQLAQEGRSQGLVLGLQRKQGGQVSALLTATCEHDEFNPSGRILVVLLDVSEKLRAEYLAYHDPLTQLPNRLLFTDRITHACQQGERNGGQFAVAFLDLDHFKAINDGLGHRIGDLLLIEVARRLERTLRGSDTISRLGGDEFVMLLDELGPGGEAQLTGEKILAALAEPCELEGVAVRISGSIGMAFYPRDGGDAATLLRHADEAMYSAKNGGRSRFATYTPGGNTQPSGISS